MNQYRVSYSEEYILNSIEHYRGQQKARIWFIAVKAICAISLTALLAIIFYGAATSEGRWPSLLLIALVPAFFLALLLQGPRIDYWLLKRRLRKSPFYGDQICISVSATGVSVKTPRSDVLLKWSAFSRACRLKSGFLLFTDPMVFHWCPDTALYEGSVAEVEHLLVKNIPGYEANVA